MADMALTDQQRQTFDDLMKKNRVVLFMKGNAHFPQCGFSAQVVKILKEMSVRFITVNVLEDPNVREAIKEYSAWPTIPQLYIDGELVGGSDIVKEMYTSGALQQKLGVTAPEPITPPRITIDDAAVKAVRDAGPAQGEHLRIEVSDAFTHELYLATKQPGDLEVAANGITILIDPLHAKRADGIRIQWVSTPDGGAFRVENPNAAKP